MLLFITTSCRLVRRQHVLNMIRNCVPMLEICQCPRDEMQSPLNANTANLVTLQWWALRVCRHTAETTSEFAVFFSRLCRTHCHLPLDETQYLTHGHHTQLILSLRLETYCSRQLPTAWAEFPHPMWDGDYLEHWWQDGRQMRG